MKILVLGSAPYPCGLAATNRVRAYASALAESGARVEYFCTIPFEGNFNRQFGNRDRAGFSSGIHFEYIAGRNPFAVKKLWRRLLGPLILLKMWWRLLKEFSNRAACPDVVLADLNASAVIVPVWLLCRWRKRPLIHAKDEYPNFLLHPRRGCVWLEKRYARLIFRMFDGIVVITKALEEFLRPYVRKDCRFMLLPILIDPEEFSALNASAAGEFTGQYIAYCGSMEGNKDGVEDLLRAFAVIAPEFPELKLFLAGGCSTEKMRRLTAIAAECGAAPRVVFTGILDRPRIAALLSGARALALARPPSIQAQGGFPTKLGEYLATGHPVVVTRVGEIPDYLTDGVNAFLAEPGEPADFAAQLRRALTRDDAGDVGRNGRMLVETVFNARFQGEKLRGFLESFVTVASEVRLIGPSELATLKTDFLICTGRDPWGTIAGGKSTFVKHLLGLSQLRLAVAANTYNPKLPVGKWVYLSWQGRDIPFFNLGYFSPSSARPLIPQRLSTRLRYRKHLDKIRQLPCRDIFTDMPESLSILGTRDWRDVCYCMGGVNNPFGNSRYWFGRYLSRRLIRSFYRSLARHATVLLASAGRQSIDAMRKDAAPLFDRLKIEPFPTRVDCRFFRQETAGGLPEGKGYPVMVGCGRLAAIKGWRLLMDALNLVVKQYPEAKLLWIGDGDERPAMEGYVRELGLVEHVEITGMVNREKIRDYLLAGDVGVVGSLLEGWSLAMLEMLAAGLPVVSTDVSGARDMIVNGKNGFVIDDRNPAHFADAVCRSLKIPDAKTEAWKMAERYDAGPQFYEDLLHCWPTLAERKRSES